MGCPATRIMSNASIFYMHYSKKIFMIGQDDRNFLLQIWFIHENKPICARKYSIMLFSLVTDQPSY